MRHDARVRHALLLAVLLALGGCANSRSGGGPDSGATTKPAIMTSAPRSVVEEYLKAAASADGARMYALIATSERDDETPQSLGDTAHDRYSPNTTWEILKEENTGSSASVVVDFKGAKVAPNPYRFTLTQEADEWRIVQSPELHEDDDRNDIKIKLRGQATVGTGLSCRLLAVAC
jgi:hypothetical protein